MLGKEFKDNMLFLCHFTWFWINPASNATRMYFLSLLTLTCSGFHHTSSGAGWCFWLHSSLKQQHKDAFQCLKQPLQAAWG